MTTYTTTFSTTRTCQKCKRKAQTTGSATLTAPSGAKVWVCAACNPYRRKTAPSPPEAA